MEHGHTAFLRLCAIGLMILVVSPCTAPFSTCDPAHLSSSGTASLSVKPAASEKASFGNVFTWHLTASLAQAPLVHSSKLQSAAARRSSRAVVLRI